MRKIQTAFPVPAFLARKLLPRHGLPRFWHAPCFSRPLQRLTPVPSALTLSRPGQGARQKRGSPQPAPPALPRAPLSRAQTLQAPCRSGLARFLLVHTPTYSRTYSLLTHNYLQAGVGTKLAGAQAYTQLPTSGGWHETCGGSGRRRRRRPVPPPGELAAAAAAAPCRRPGSSPPPPPPPHDVAGGKGLTCTYKRGMLILRRTAEPVTLGAM